jgi:hypothetical protein
VSIADLRATAPWDELWTLQLLGWLDRCSIEIESRDDAILECSGGSVPEPFSLASVGPLHKAVGAAIR